MSWFSDLIERRTKVSVTSYVDYDTKFEKFIIASRKGYLTDFGGFHRNPGQAHSFWTKDEAVQKALKMRFHVVRFNRLRQDERE